MLLVVHGTNDLGLSRPAPQYPAALSRAGIAHGFCDAETPLCAFSLAESYDGLFLTGGGDSDPLLYGQSRGAKLSPVSKMRDENELSLVLSFFARKKPVFGVCRGMQCVNVALGGTLHQDIASHAGTRHIVRFCENSPFAPLREAVVNSFHHQSAARLAPPLFPAAVARDGTIEAVSSNVSPVLAVQWHPERPDGGVTDEFFRIVRQMLEASD